MRAIAECAVPVIGAINGPAIGAGLAFAAVCDVLIASDTATFGTTEINVGLLGASAHLSLLVGRHKARELFFSGELIGAAELERYGSVRAVVPPDELLPAARQFASTLAAKSPIALRLAKESMNRVEQPAAVGGLPDGAGLHGSPARVRGQPRGPARVPREARTALALAIEIEYPQFMEFDLFSVDDHVIEHATVWTDRLPTKLHEAGPHVVEEDGRESGSTRAPGT